MLTSGALVPDMTIVKTVYHPPKTSKGFGGTHASPLIDLEFRDLKVLHELFEMEEIDEIINNVQDRLDQLYPEPYWDETSDESLNEFLS